MTDASHCPHTKCAGYGFWIASERGKKAGSGAFNFEVTTAPEAETLAICEALYHAIHVGLVQKLDTVLFQTDCIPAIEVYTGGRRRYKGREQDALEYLSLLASEYMLKIQFRHVKAHTTNQDQRSKCNAHCDTAAKNEMRRLREKKTNGKNKTFVSSKRGTGKNKVSRSGKPKARRYSGFNERRKSVKSNIKTHSK